MIAEKECKVQGCCVTSEYLTLPNRNDSDNPDINSPSVAIEILKALIYTPYAIALFVYGVSRHTLYKPKRSLWDFQTAISIGGLQLFRCILKTNHISFWRNILRLSPVKNPPNFNDASFVVPKGTHYGLFKSLSEEEDGTRIINADWIYYRNPTSQNEKIIYYIPGGAFIFFDKRCYAALCSALQDTCQRNIFAVKYRLSPESHFPGPIYDAFKGYLHLINDCKIDPKNITLCGDSAGGNLCLSLLFYLRDHGYPLPNGSILFSPWIDLSYSYPSWLEYHSFDYLPERPTFDKPHVNPSRCYLGRENYYALTQHPYGSLHYTKNLENLPPMLIQSGGCEVLVDEIRAFASRLENSKTTRITYEEYEDMFHVFQSIPTSRTKAALEGVKKWLKQEESNKE